MSQARARFCPANQPSFALETRKRRLIYSCTLKNATESANDHNLYVSFLNAEETYL